MSYNLVLQDAFDAARGLLNYCYQIQALARGGDLPPAYPRPKILNLPPEARPPAVARQLIDGLARCYADVQPRISEALDALAAVSGVSTVAWAHGLSTHQTVLSLARDLVVAAKDQEWEDVKNWLAALPLINPSLTAIQLAKEWQDAERAAARGQGAAPAGQNHASPADSNPTIWFHAERQYSIDRVTPLKVSEEVDCILQAFLASPAAMETSDLESKSGVTNVSRAMQALATWNEGIFKQAVRIPSGKARGGYFARVKRL